MRSIGSDGRVELSGVEKTTAEGGVSGKVLGKSRPERAG